MAEFRTGKSPAWGRFLMVWAIILLLLGGTGCYLLYQYLGIYEVTRPEPVLDEFLETTDIHDIALRAGENVPFELTEFEDPKELYASYIDAIDLSKAVSYRLNSDKSAPDRLVYDVRSGPNMLCSVALIPDGDTPGFGRNYWAVSEVSAAIITELLPSVTASVETVSGMELSLNGKPLSEEYISGDPADIPDLTRYEAEMENPPKYLTYEIGPLYGDIHLTDASGNSIAPDGEVEDDTVHFQVISETQSLEITAPEDLPVYINGVRLKMADLVSSSIGVFEGLEPYTQGAACMTDLYRIDGLYLKPVVTALEDDGRETTPIAAAENSYIFFHEGEEETEAQMYSIVERFFNAYMEYSAHAFEYTRFSNLLGTILPQSSLYQYVLRSQEAMYWASGTQAEYSDLRYDNFHMVSDTCFVCTVIYSADMTAKNWYEQYSYELENAYELVFVFANGKWLAAGMDAITSA